MASFKPKQYGHILCASLLALSSSLLDAQAPPAVRPPPVVVVGPATLNRLMKEAEEGFVAKKYDVAIVKIEELIKALGPNPKGPMDMLYFNIGLAHLLGGNLAKAETAFEDVIKRFPKSEYTSRSYLGLGKSIMDQGGPQRMQAALDPLKRAAADPKYRTEAGLYLGQAYNELKQPEDALKVFRSLMGSDVKTPQQTSAAVEVIGLLADTGKLDDLVAYLDRLINQEGVRDSMAWYANQVAKKGDELVQADKLEEALAIYRSIPPRAEILSIQQAALDGKRKDLKIIEDRVKAEAAKPIEQRTNLGEYLSTLKGSIEQSETAIKAIEALPQLDAAMLMRRGRCLYNLKREEEALICFKTLRMKYETAVDAKSAAFAEVVLYNKLQNIDKLLELGERYLLKYPDAENAEQVALLVGEILVQRGKWDRVETWYGDLKARFPQSPDLDRYTFYQGIAKFQGGNHAEAASLLSGFIKTYPNSDKIETALYYVAMAHFLTNNYKQTLVACKEYLTKFPDGHFAGDMIYRLAFIDSNDKTVSPDKIVRDLDGFIQVHPDDPAAGSILCLLADTAKKMTAEQARGANPEDIALEAYKKAIYTKSPDDVVQYAIDSATTILQGRKDWAGIAELHRKFVETYPNSPMVMGSIVWIVKAMQREGKVKEGTQMIADQLKLKIGDPTSELVELLIDELVKSFVPRNVKPANIDPEAVDKELVDLLNKVAEGKENATTNARIYYARARLSQALKRNEKSELYLKGIATTSTDPAALSPALLTVVGDIHLKAGKLDEAEAMFQRLKDRFADSSFSDAGPVGLGQVALARKKPDEALRIFDNALLNPGMSRFKEANLGKLEALVQTGQDKLAEDLGNEIVGNKMFRGEAAGKAYLLMAKGYRLQAPKAPNIDATRELLKKAHFTYQRVQSAYKSFPDVCAEAFWQDYETALELHDDKLAAEVLELLATLPKLEKTVRAEEARKKLNK